jgi:predicted dehydrogenase
MKQKMRLGIIGGGLMGREAASAFGRWFVLQDFPVQVELVAVCDLQESLLEWFRGVPTVKLLTKDHRELLRSPDVDVVYVAVPHNLHEGLYLDVLNAGKDLLAEKPFGIDLRAARVIRDAAAKSGRFVRCSSEFPFMPGAQRAIAMGQAGQFGKLLEIHSCFWHASDLDPTKPINWKRQTKFCGEIGVMGDLGMHVVHVPFRLGWFPKRVFAQLQKIYTERPDGKGGTAACDTWDNALLHCDVDIAGQQDVPMRLEMKRLAWRSSARMAACVTARRSRRRCGPSSAARNRSGSARTSGTAWPSRRSPAEFSRPASRIASSRCGRLTRRNGLARWGRSSVA